MLPARLPQVQMLPHLGQLHSPTEDSSLTNTIKIQIQYQFILTNTIQLQIQMQNNITSPPQIQIQIQIQYHFTFTNTISLLPHNYTFTITQKYIGKGFSFTNTNTSRQKYGGTIVKRASARTIFDSGKCGNHSGLLTNLSQIWENKFFWWSRCCGGDTKEMAERR